MELADKESKYKSKKVKADGYTFDSKDEFLYYESLKKRTINNEIRGFELQPKYILIPAFEKLGKKYKAITYTPDFRVTHVDGSVELIDVKGYSTQQGELRHKLFNFFYPDLKLTWVSRNLKWGDEYGFIDYFELNKIRRVNKKTKSNSLPTQEGIA